jgi:hypothetical protein
MFRAFGLALLCLFSCVAGTSAADLSKIDRVIRKEPAYKASPKYCLLVWGAKASTRTWLVQDGNVLYVDRNGDGDLTDTKPIKGREEAEEFPASLSDGWWVSIVANPDFPWDFEGRPAQKPREFGTWQHC